MKRILIAGRSCSSAGSPAAGAGRTGAAAAVDIAAAAAEAVAGTEDTAAAAGHTAEAAAGRSLGAAAVVDAEEGWRRPEVAAEAEEVGMRVVRGAGKTPVEAETGERMRGSQSGLTGRHSGYSRCSWLVSDIHSRNPLNKDLDRNSQREEGDRCHSSLPGSCCYHRDEQQRQKGCSKGPEQVGQQEVVAAVDTCSDRCKIDHTAFAELPAEDSSFGSREQPEHLEDILAVGSADYYTST